MKGEHVEPVPGERLAGKTSVVEGAVQKVSGAIAGEHTAGAVTAVGRGRKAEDQQLCLWIAKTRKRLAPVFLIAIHTTLLLGDLADISGQAGAAGTGDDTFLEDSNSVSWLLRTCRTHQTLKGNF